MNNAKPAARTSSRTPKPTMKTNTIDISDDDFDEFVLEPKSKKKAARKAPASAKSSPATTGKRKGTTTISTTQQKKKTKKQEEEEYKEPKEIGGHRWQGAGMTYPASHPELDIIGRTTEMDECFLPPFAMEKMMTENAPLREVLKNPIDLWRKTLTEEDREMLKKMLPETTRNDENLVENVVKDLFTGKTFHFDNPAERVWNQIREGERHPHFVRAKRIRKELQKRNSFLSLRKKHDEVVDNLDQMRKLWMRLGEEVGMKERRKLWEEHLDVKAQRRKNLENARKKNASLAKQMKQQKTQGGGGGGGSEREGSVSAFGGADEQEAPPT
ncbi:unnamed protein product [Bathycoccus prasinos]